MNAALTNDHKRQPNRLPRVRRRRGTSPPRGTLWPMRRRGTVHFTGNYWRFHEIDFVEVSRRGTVPGASLADWPADLRRPGAILHPGRVGDRRVGPGPVPALSIRRAASRIPPAATHHVQGRTDGARSGETGLARLPSPMAILSQPYRGRAACVHCGFCENFGCEMEAKSSTLVTMIPEAASRTGRCEIRPSSYVRKVEIDRRGRVTGVRYFNRDRKEVSSASARAVILCANGAETPRLLLNSRSGTFPRGLANSSGAVGRNSMSQQRLLRRWTLREGSERLPKRGRYPSHPGFLRAAGVTRYLGWRRYRHQVRLPAGRLCTLWSGDGFDRWGSDFKHRLHQRFNHTAYALGHPTSLPVESNTISLDPSLKDDWGLPALQMTFRNIPTIAGCRNTCWPARWSCSRRPGAVERWTYAPGPAPFPQVHLLGTLVAWATIRRRRWSIATTARTTFPISSWWMAAAS